MTEQNIRNNTDAYYMVQLSNAIYHYNQCEYVQLQCIRAELHNCNMLLLWQNLIDLAEFNSMEIFVNEMLGGKTDAGIRY